ncbi:unnamed protein product, partial [Chrysoparadoxa australica]
MRSIARVDIDRIIKDVDVDALQEFIENITFSDISTDEMCLYSDESFIKLFQLSQLTLEYLLSVQDSLATNLEGIAKKHSELEKEVKEGKDRLQMQSHHEKKLKKEIRQKRKTISKYEQLLAAAPLQSGHHSCAMCGKLFRGAAYLQEHERKHHVRKVPGCHIPGESAPVLAEPEPQEKKEQQIRVYVQLSSGPFIDLVVSDA